MFEGGIAADYEETQSSKIQTIWQLALLVLTVEYHDFSYILSWGCKETECNKFKGIQQNTKLLHFFLLKIFGFNFNLN